MLTRPAQRQDSSPDTPSSPTYDLLAAGHYRHPSLRSESPRPSGESDDHDASAESLADLKRPPDDRFGHRPRRPGQIEVDRPRPVSASTDRTSSSPDGSSLSASPTPFPPAHDPTPPRSPVGRPVASTLLAHMGRQRRLTTSAAGGHVSPFLNGRTTSLQTSASISESTGNGAGRTTVRTPYPRPESQHAAHRGLGPSGHSPVVRRLDTSLGHGRPPGLEEPMRSSVRSAVTVYSSSTERSSVWTKDTSTNTSAIPNQDVADDSSAGMSVDDAIGMYEQGFHDHQRDEPGSPPTFLPSDHHHHDSPRPSRPSRPPTATSESHDRRGTTRDNGPPSAEEMPVLEQVQDKPESSEMSELASTPKVVIPPRDRYGFRKSSHYVSLAQYDAWHPSYVVYVERRTKKWIALLRSQNLSTDHPVKFPARSAKVKRFVRKGIPPDWRGAAWFWYAGGQAHLDRNVGLYARLVDKAANGDVNRNDREMIERDLHRTFPDNIRFKPDPTTLSDDAAGKAGGGDVLDGIGGGGDRSPVDDVETPIIHALRRVLQAFSIHDPKVGYCQSLNFLAGLLLLFMEEERAFWMLCIITREYLPGTHELNLEGANVDLAVLKMSIRETMPAIWAKIGGELDGSPNDQQPSTQLPPVFLCMTAWFMSCFIGTLPTETVLRVWDAFFYEGSRTLFRVALAILKVGEAQIRAVKDPMEIFQVVQTIPRCLVDANSLMDTYVKRRRTGAGLHVTQDLVDARRVYWRAVHAQEKAVRLATTHHYHHHNGGEASVSSSSTIPANPTVIPPIHRSRSGGGGGGGDGILLIERMKQENQNRMKIF